LRCASGAAHGGAPVAERASRACRWTPAPPAPAPEMARPPHGRSASATGKLDTAGGTIRRWPSATEASCAALVRPKCRWT
jgi:hypothetical protein